MPLDDEVECRYSFKATRILRKAVRYVANEHGVSEWEIVFQAVAHYKPVLEMMERLRKGERYVVG